MLQLLLVYESEFAPFFSNVAVTFFAVIAYKVLFPVNVISSPTLYFAVVALALSANPIIIPFSLVIFGSFTVQLNSYVLHVNCAFSMLAPFPTSFTVYVLLSFFASLLNALSGTVILAFDDIFPALSFTITVYVPAFVTSYVEAFIYPLLFQLYESIPDASSFAFACNTILFVVFSFTIISTVGGVLSILSISTTLFSVLFPASSFITIFTSSFSLVSY